MIAVLCVLALCTSMVMGTVTKEEVNALVHKDHGVYMVTEETYDQFMNWNPQVFICFYYNTTAE
jgi:hypothetical protein